MGEIIPRVWTRVRVQVRPRVGIRVGLRVGDRIRLGVELRVGFRVEDRVRLRVGIRVRLRVGLRVEINLTGDISKDWQRPNKRNQTNQISFVARQQSIFYFFQFTKVKKKIIRNVLEHYIYSSLFNKKNS